MGGIPECSLRTWDSCPVTRGPGGQWSQPGPSPHVLGLALIRRGTLCTSGLASLAPGRCVLWGDALLGLSRTDSDRCPRHLQRRLCSPHTHVHPGRAGNSWSRRPRTEAVLPPSPTASESRGPSLTGSRAEASVDVSPAGLEGGKPVHPADAGAGVTVTKIEFGIVVRFSAFHLAGVGGR